MQFYHVERKPLFDVSLISRRHTSGIGIDLRCDYCHRLNTTLSFAFIKNYSFGYKNRLISVHVPFHLQVEMKSKYVLEKIISFIYIFYLIFKINLSCISETN